MWVEKYWDTSIEQWTLPEIIFDVNVPLTVEQKELVVNTISSYIENYKLAWLYTERSIHITAFTQKEDINDLSLAQTSWTTIALNTLVWYESRSHVQIANIIRHEMWHTIPTIRNNAISFLLTTWDKILATEWFRFVVLPSGVETEKFLYVIEEAFCDLLAFDQALAVGELYDVVNYVNYANQLLLMNLCKERNMSLQTLIDLYRASDIYWFTSSILGCTNPDVYDIEFVLNCFTWLAMSASWLISDAEKKSSTNPWLLDMLPTNIGILADRKKNEILNYQK